MDVLADFLGGDAASAGARAHYVSMAKNVLCGSHALLEVSSDSYPVSIAVGGMTMENFWDDAVEPLAISLERFIELMAS